MQERHWLWQWATSPVVSNHCVGGSHRPGCNSLNVPTLPSPMVKDLMPLTFQSTEHLDPSCHLGERRTAGQAFCGNHPSVPHTPLYKFSAASKGWILDSSISCLASELLEKFIHHALPKVHRRVFAPRMPLADTFLGRKAALTIPLLRVPDPWLMAGCDIDAMDASKLINPSRSLWMGEGASPQIRLVNEVQLPEFKFIFTQLFSRRCGLRGNLVLL